MAAPALSVIGNTQIAEISNAILALANSDEFQVANPVEGIALVLVFSLPDNRVRVAITGADTAPATTVSTEASGLVLGVTLGAIAPDFSSIEPAIATLL